MDLDLDDTTYEDDYTNDNYVYKFDVEFIDIFKDKYELEKQNNENIDEENKNEVNGEEENKVNTSNKDYGFTGTVEVSGYPIIKERVDELGDGSKHRYVYFYILQSNNKEFDKYVQNMSGNSFVSDNAIGIGCVIDNNIKYYNSSDKNGDKEYTLSIDISNKILNSNKDNPVRLKLERLPLSIGKGAPICYSHITEINIVE